MKTFWAVTKNYPGYLPIDEPTIFGTKVEAVKYAKGERDGYREAGYVVLGDIRRDYQYQVWPKRNREYALPILITVQPVDDVEWQEWV